LLVDLLPGNDPDLARNIARLKQVKKELTAAAEAYFRVNTEKWSQVRSLYVKGGAVESRLVQMAPDAARHHVNLGTGTGPILDVLAARA
jgi:hypothetical protein